MRYRPLGRTGQYVSEICLGAMTFHGGSAGAMWRNIGTLDQAASTKLVGRALEAGVNFIDTANVYSEGQSEVQVGQALRDLGVKREDVIIAHLGNGASMCAVRDGRAVASTMGFTALDGLAMGTRCGQLDPGVVLYLMAEKKMSADEISDLLWKNSGLKGMSGLSQDMRELEASTSPAARDAIAYFVSRIRRELAGLAATVGGAEAIVFTAGIGEHSWKVREAVLSDMKWMGIHIDAEANRANAQIISAKNSPTIVFVIPTNEELMIAEHTVRAAGVGK